MPKSTKKTAKKKAKKVYKYSLTLNVHNENLEFEGDTMSECFAKFEVPDFIKSMVYITGKTKDKAAEMIYNGREAQRMFANHGSVAVLASNLEKRLA